MEEAINWWNTLTENEQFLLIIKYNFSLVDPKKIKPNQIRSIFVLNKNS